MDQPSPYSLHVVKQPQISGQNQQQYASSSLQAAVANPDLHLNQSAPLVSVHNGILDIGSEHGLAALQDPPDGEKPFYPYSTLIRYAIKGSPQQKLLLEDIYAAIESRFPYFTNAPVGWKNSVRHNLSLNPCFEKVARPLTDRGKGAYWTVNDKVDPGSGLHRNRKNSTASPSSETKPRKRGRPSNRDMYAEEAARAAARNSTGSNSAFMAAQAGDSNQDIMLHEAGPSDLSARKDTVPGPSSVLEPNTNYTLDGMGMMGLDPSIGQFMPPVDQNGNKLVYTSWPGFPPGAVAIRYVIDPNETELVPEFDNDNNPIWKRIWLNELVKLRRATYEQDSHAADPEWYRAMVERVRAAFLQPDLAYPHDNDRDAEGDPEEPEGELLEA